MGLRTSTPQATSPLAPDAASPATASPATASLAAASPAAASTGVAEKTGVAPAGAEIPPGWPAWLIERAGATAPAAEPTAPVADATPAAAAIAAFPPLSGLYVHVPFCAQICAYCDFAREIAREDRIERYLAAAAREVELALPAGFAPDTVFFGGGTPSVLTPAHWRRLMQALERRVDFSRAREVTIECNPGTLDAGKLDAWQAAGVNRISFGAQTFDPAQLLVLGRIHTREEIPAAVAFARQAGLANASIDLIYGLPGQTLADFEQSLEAAQALPITHLSAYALTYEPGTPFHVLREQGRLTPCDEDLVGAMYRRAMEYLAGAGFEQYEISNYSRGRGHAAVHNLVYWHRRRCLAIGPSASSLQDGRRRTTGRDLGRWAEALEAGRRPEAVEEELTGPAAAGEAFVLRLRLNEGVDLAEFARVFGRDPTAGLADRIVLWQRLGLVEYRPGQLLRLTAAGRPVADAMLCEFVQC